MNRSIRRLILATVLAGAALSLPACGDTATTGGTTPAARQPESPVIDPCTLVPSGALEGALGEPLTQQGPASPAAGGTSCAWSFNGNGRPGSLTITAWQGAAFFTADFGESLDGVGDDARIDASLGAVLFRAGDHVVEIQILPSSQLDATTSIAELAARAL